MSKTIDIEIELSPWQKKVYDSFNKYRFTVISAGRQSGKTWLCCFFIVLKSIQNKDWISWWVAPAYPLARIAMRRIIQFCLKSKIPIKVNKSELRITLPNNSVIWFKSSDNEDGLRAETVNFIIIDEMGFIKRDSYLYAIRGTITATRASIVFIGTPKGKNLFYELYLKGQDKEEKDYISYQFESKESPYFPEKEWEDVSRLPQRVFDQEYRAIFIDDGGEVFRNIRECVKGQLEDANLRKTYYAGIDIAKSSDYTVICILDHNGHLCAFDRFNDIAWTIQKGRIIQKIKEYNAVALIDSTGIGDPILDDLLMANINISGYKFTNQSKRVLIESLSMAIEKNEISFPDIPELINELNIFTFEQLPSGTIRYNAPSGLHDDCVIALSLAHIQYSGTRGWSDAFDYNTGRISVEADW